MISSKISGEGAAQMSSEVASRTPIHAKRFPFMGIPQTLREEIIRMSLPHNMKVALPKYTPGTDPKFVPALSTLGSEELRLECVLAVLENATFRVSSMDEAVNLRIWLTSIGFAPLRLGNLSPLKNGFSAVRALSFSDTNRVRVHKDTFYNRGRLSSYYHNTKIEPSTCAGDLELTRMCTDLRTVEIAVSLPEKFLREMSVNYWRSMNEIILQVGGFGKYQLNKLLKLRGLKVLRLCFFNSVWEKEDLMGPILEWLRKEFEKRGQAVEIVEKDHDW